jgi:vacuole morphology and inheritance protein 14
MALTTSRLVKQLATSEDFQRIVSLTNVLRKEFVFSTNANSRKGGLIGLAATAIALGQVSFSSSTLY